MGALRTSFQMLFDAVKSAQEENTMFQHLLGNIKSTLESLQPLIKDIEKYNSKEGRENYAIQMEEGAKLVQKCSKVGVGRKHAYTKKLNQLDKSLRRVFDVLKLQVMRDARETLVPLRKIETVLSRIEERLKIKNNQPEMVKCSSAVPEAPSVTVGLDLPLKELKVKLLKDEKVSMLVLTAAGGCGKTTLAKMFCQDQEVKDTFKNNIFFVNVSKKPNLDLIVHELYQRKGSELPAFENEVMAAKWLQQFLKESSQNPLLFVLDDVWSESESLLEKFDQFKFSNCKILVTSRFAFPRFGSPYHLAPLNDEDAMDLFHYSASLEDKSSYTYEDLSRKIIKRFKGCPLAIALVGRSLRGQPIEIWHKRVVEWCKGSSILDSDRDLLACLQSSLDALDKEKAIIKECFLDLGSFPEDQRIAAAALIDMWAELYGLDEEILTIANLHELTARSLATLVVTRHEREADGYYTEHFVTQHNMLRELAIHQGSQDPIEHRKRLFINICGDKLPKWLTEQKYQAIKARLLSISTGSINLSLPRTDYLIESSFESLCYAKYVSGFSQNGCSQNAISNAQRRRKNVPTPPSETSIHTGISTTTHQNMEKYNTKEGLQNFAIQMEEGAKLVQKCSKVGLWRKYKYVNKLHQLDKSLRRVLILKRLGVRLWCLNRSQLRSVVHACVDCCWRLTLPKKFCPDQEVKGMLSMISTIFLVKFYVLLKK
ncbi:hypothetical protein DVH24_029997 [Malus domestica]|uniref:RPW8 domain-containing protein n=1 Tax=Malus domestica TaxID=3750 RepID=A0A498HUY8_MALDO|nr:hypothetical protein DVH24_029997 [Malus domestica]